MRESHPGRQRSIDLLRIVAAFGIAWFHMQAPGVALPALGGLTPGIHLVHPLAILAWHAAGGGPPGLGAAATGAGARVGRALSAAGKAAARPARGPA